MSFSVRDSINTKKLTLVYGAKSAPVSSSLGLVAKSRSFGAFVKRNESSHSLFLERLDLTIAYAASSGGTCILPAIEDWLVKLIEDEGVEDAQNFQAGVVYPLDTKLYLAEITHGTVSSEFVVLPGKAEEKLDAWAKDGLTVFCFKGGKQESIASNYATPEELSIDVNAHRLQFNFVAFARNRLVHTLHIIFGAALLILIATAFLYSHDGYQDVVDLMPTPVVIAPKSEYSASDQLRNLATAMHLTKSLFGSGVETFAYSFSDNQIAYLGATDVDQYPEVVQRFAKIHGLEYDYSKSGWVLRSNVPGYDQKVVVAKPESEVIGAILNLPRMGIGYLSLDTKLERDRYNQYVYKLTLQGPTPYSLHQIAEAVEGLPVTVTNMACKTVPFSFYIENCLISMSVITLKS